VLAGADEVQLGPVRVPAGDGVDDRAETRELVRVDLVPARAQGLHDLPGVDEQRHLVRVDDRARVAADGDVRQFEGLLLLHAPGNTFIRDLRQGETLLVQPSSLLYRDVTVRVALHLEYPRNTGLSFWRSSWSYRTIWVRLWGPGRVAVQSVYEPPEDTETIRRHSYATTHRW